MSSASSTARLRRGSPVLCGFKRGLQWASRPRFLGSTMRLRLLARKCDLESIALLARPPACKASAGVESSGRTPASEPFWANVQGGDSRPSEADVTVIELGRLGANRRLD